MVPRPDALLAGHEGDLGVSRHRQPQVGEARCGAFRPRSSDWPLREGSLDLLLAGYYSLAYAAIRHMLETFVQYFYVVVQPEEATGGIGNPSALRYGRRRHA